MAILEPHHFKSYKLHKLTQSINVAANNERFRLRFSSRPTVPSLLSSARRPGNTCPAFFWPWLGTPPPRSRPRRQMTRERERVGFAPSVVCDSGGKCVLVCCLRHTWEQKHFRLDADLTSLQEQSRVRSVGGTQRFVGYFYNQKLYNFVFLNAKTIGIFRSERNRLFPWKYRFQPIPIPLKVSHLI